jgi:hypothetical protein
MIVSLTIVRYRTTLIPLALFAMAVHRLSISRQKGCTFWKLLGSGKSGTFDLKPDWQQWGLLAVWDDQSSFDVFYRQSFIANWWRRFTTEQWTILLSPMQSRGQWDGKEPFGKPNESINSEPVAVLTRATIRLKKLKAFWAHVDGVSHMMAAAPGYITSFGIGEAPFYRQSTFSIWRNLDDVKGFAYRSKEHAEVIKKTRDDDWYSEELFARFKIIDAFGTLHGADPLKGLLKFATDENNS